jgi:thiamine kinase-like enzyme
MRLADDLAPAVRTYLEAHPEVVPPPFHLRLLAAGEYNLNYLATPADGTPALAHRADGTRDGSPQPAAVVVRLSTGSQEVAAGAQQVLYEARALRLLEPSGVAPRLLHVDTTPVGLPYGLLIEEFLPGRPLEYLDPADLSRAAHTLARLHAFRLPEADSTLLRIERPLSMYLQFGREMLAPYRTAPDASGEALRILDAVERTLSAQAHLEDSRFPPSERGVVHTDVQAHNFVVTDVATDTATGSAGDRAVTRLVDWEKPMLDDPTYDLCHFLAPTTTRWKCGVTLAEPAQETFMEAYLSAREGQLQAPVAQREPGGARWRDALSERRRIRQPYVHWRAITWCTMAWVEYQRPDRPLRHQDTWERITEYLHPEFLEVLFEPVLSGVSWWE